MKEKSRKLTDAVFPAWYQVLEKKNPKVDATTGIVLVKMNATVKFKIFMTFVVNLTVHWEYLSPANNRSKAEIP